MKHSNIHGRQKRPATVGCVDGTARSRPTPEPGYCPIATTKTWTPPNDECSEYLLLSASVSLCLSKVCLFPTQSPSVYVCVDNRGAVEATSKAKRRIGLRNKSEGLLSVATGSFITCHFPNRSEHVLDGTGSHPGVRRGTHHGVRFSGPRMAVREYGGVVPCSGERDRYRGCACLDNAELEQVLHESECTHVQGKRTCGYWGIAGDQVGRSMTFSGSAGVAKTSWARRRDKTDARTLYG